MSEPAIAIGRAGADDAPEIGRLLHDFNAEYDDPTPGPAAVAERIATLLAGGDTEVLLAQEGDGGGERGLGVAVMRFRGSIWSTKPECYLAELYVAPDRRGEGIGRSLLEAAIELARERGADHIELGTSEDDVAARALYESLGFTNREGRPDGPIMYFYEREI